MPLIIYRAGVTAVTAKQMNSVLGNVLKLILNNIGAEDAPWMNRIASKFKYVILICSC